MAVTTIESSQVRVQAIQRSDLNTSTVGAAVAAKLIQGTGISLSSTGADAGTGDVTVSLSATAVSAGLLSLSAAYNLLASDNNKYAICSGGSWTLGLPAPALGLNYDVRNDQGITGTTGTITISAASGTIDGAASLALLAGQEVRIRTDGTNWRTFGRQRNVVVGTQDISASTASAFFLLPPGYRYYELNWEAIVGSTDGQQLTINVSSDGGVTWKTDSTYGNDIVYQSSATAVANQYAAAAFGYVSPPVTYSASSNQVAAYSYCKFWPGNAQRATHWKYEAWGYNATPVLACYIGAGHYLGVLGPFNAIRYQMASGNILASQLTVKGII